MSDQSRLKAWFDTPDAALFLDCVTAQMNEHYFEAINTDEKSESDGDKFSNQARAHLSKAKRINTFLSVLQEFASRDYEFHKLKVQ